MLNYTRHYKDTIQDKLMICHRFVTNLLEYKCTKLNEGLFDFTQIYYRLKDYDHVTHDVPHFLGQWAKSQDQSVTMS